MLRNSININNINNLLSVLCGYFLHYQRNTREKVMNFIEIVFEKNRYGLTYFLFFAIMFLILPPLVHAQAPTASTEAASAIGTTIATVNGTINANGSETTVTFEYGLNASYGGYFTADQSPVSGSANTAMSATISDSSPTPPITFG